MQFSTLNRVIALFLIGGFVVTLAAVAIKDNIGDVFGQYFKNGLAPSAAVFLAVALLSTTALAGTIVDALGNLTVRRLVGRTLAGRRSLARLFFCAKHFEARNRWEKKFRGALENSNLRELANEEEMMKGLSAAIFFRTTEKEHMEWLTQHYSMYHMAANFVVILLAGAIWLCFHKSYCWAGGSFFSAYLLTTFSLDIYLYTYQLTFRNAYLALKDADHAEGTNSHL